MFKKPHYVQIIGSLYLTFTLAISSFAYLPLTAYAEELTHNTEQEVVVENGSDHSNQDTSHNTSIESGHVSENTTETEVHDSPQNTDNVDHGDHEIVEEDNHEGQTDTHVDTNHEDNNEGDHNNGEDEHGNGVEEGNHDQGHDGEEHENGGGDVGGGDTHGDHDGGDGDINTSPCFNTNDLEDSTAEPVMHGLDPISLQDIFNQKSINKNVTSDQKQYQVFNLLKSNTSIDVELVKSVTAIPSSVFGYYTSGSVSSFVPLFTPATSTNFPTATHFNEGQKVTFTIALPHNISFAIAVPQTASSSVFRTSENNLNIGGLDQMVAYRTGDNTFIVAFEDLKLDESDKDYNDIIVKITINSCESITPPPPHDNHPPIITLIGSSTINILEGTTFTDPGATATDIEDGDLTSHIVKTGTVNTSIVGNHTITYSVTDSAGASSSVTRTVVVNPNINACRYGTNGELSYDQFVLARNAGLIHYSISTSTGITAKAIIENNTNCTFPTSLSTYRMFDLVLSHQQLLDTTNLVNATGTTILEVDLSNCMTQVDLWYGLAPTTLIENPYNAPPLPVVLASTFTNYGHFCVATPPQENHPPLISLLGSNPLTLTVGSTFTDPGATATDTEDGNLTSHIVVAGSVNTATTSTSTLVYSVTDSGGLSASTTRTVLVTATTTGGGNGGGGGGTTTPSANLAVTKSVDKTNPNVGDTVTYLINVTNAGPDSALGVNITDSLPSGLSFVSATSTIGSYSTTSGVWTVGSLTNGASGTLTIIATINLGTEGQKITNIATASSTVADSNQSNNIGSADLNVVTPSNNGGGGNGGGGGSNNNGGGGSGGIGGHRHDIGGIASSAVSGGLGACSYLRDYLRRDWNNDPSEVLKVQYFMNKFEGENLALSSVFDQPTFDAVSRFQDKYFSDILAPWGHTAPTGFVYILTKKKINEIYCNTIYTLSQGDQNEIRDFKAFIDGLRGSGGELPDASGFVGILNSGNSTTPSDELTLGDDSTELGNENAEDGILSTNILRNAAVSLFAIPSSLSGFIKSTGILVLVLIIIYTLASLFTGGSSLQDEAGKINLRRKKFIWEGILLLVSIAIASLLSYFYIVLPLAIIFLIVLGMLVFGNHKNNYVTQDNKERVTTTINIEPTTPTPSYDKSLEELVNDIKKKEEAGEVMTESTDTSKKAFKGILDHTDTL